MNNFFCLLGIILNTVGTLFTLWTVFSTKSSDVGTAAEHDNRHKTFPVEKRRIIIGFVVIVMGNVLQAVSLFL